MSELLEQKQYQDISLNVSTPSNESRKRARSFSISPVQVIDFQPFKKNKPVNKASQEPAQEESSNMTDMEQTVDNQSASQYIVLGQINASQSQAQAQFPNVPTMPSHMQILPSDLSSGGQSVDHNQFKLAESDIMGIADQLKILMKDQVRDVVEQVNHSLLGRIAELEVSNKNLQKEVQSLKKENFELKERVATLDREVDDLEQYGRRNAVRISGIKETPDEDTDEIVMNLCKNLNVKMNPMELGRSHRVGRPAKNKTRAIIVKFATYRARQRLYDARFSLKGNGNYDKVFINEDLTFRRNKLLYCARSMAKEGKITAAWSADGDIKVVNSKGDRSLITDIGDLEKFSGHTYIPAAARGIAQATAGS